MDAKIKIAYIFVDLLLPLMLGYLLHSKRWISENFCDNLIIVNIIFFSTVLSILSFWNLPLQLELLWLPLFGILLSFIPGAAAFMISSKKYENSLDKGSYLASAILSNIGVLGGLCAYILFGETGFAYTQIVALFQNLVLFLFCFPMAQYYRQKASNQQDNRQKQSLSALFFNRNQLPVLGLAIGMLLYLGNVPRPKLLGDLFNPLVHLSAWTALIPVGYSINFSEMKQYYRTILDLVPIKFIITPLISYVIARQLFNDPIVLGTILILASVPTGINAVITSRLYSLNLNVSGAAFVLTTAIFLFVIYPLLFIWFTLI